jgi:hypothetical protein
MAGVMSSVGRLRTHVLVRRRLFVVWDEALSPIMQRWPSHQAEDIGAMFGVPSGLRVLIRMTGVPQQRIAGHIEWCMARLEWGEGTSYNDFRVIGQIRLGGLFGGFG